VVHQGVSYDKPIAADGAISIDVFDAATKVPGVTGNIEIIRAGTRGATLHVSDMIEVLNRSNPPVTQAGTRSFEVFLPAGALIASVLAAGPDNMAASISATLIPGAPGHYFVSYPLLPGATKFAFNYDLPYKGHAVLSAKSSYSFKQLAVMIPPTMAFASRSSAFQALPVGADRFHVEAAENVSAGDTLEFEISGSGELPPAHQQSPAAPNSLAAASIPAAPATAAVSPSANSMPRSASLKTIATHSSTAWWFVLGIAAFALMICASFALRQQTLRRSRAAFVAQPRVPLPQSPAPLVEALKEGLFQLESDRMEGVICVEDYASAKQALEGTIHWALTRTQRRETQTHVLQ
jgi:hypothetical protein